MNGSQLRARWDDIGEACWDDTGINTIRSCISFKCFTNFQKKSKTGIKTSKQDISLTKQHLILAKEDALSRKKSIHVR